MSSSARAFAPGNISCVFKVYEHKNPRWMGSYGFGFTLDEGVTAEASIAKKNDVIFNKKAINFPTVLSLIRKLTNKKIRISLTSKLPLGCGFGLSGASALASAYSINKLLNLMKSRKYLAVMAHTAEVENRTGLGDVVNQYYGGFCIKEKPSSYFEVNKLPIKAVNGYCRHFGKISTKSIINNPKLREKINSAASTALNSLRTDYKINFSQIIKISKGFVVNSGLLKDKRTAQTISQIEKNNGNASMIMLGNAVFSDIPFKESTGFKIKDKGAHLL